MKLYFVDKISYDFPFMLLSKVGILDIYRIYVRDTGGGRQDCYVNRVTGGNKIPKCLS